MSLSSWRLDARGISQRILELGAAPGSEDPAAGPPLVCLHGFLDHGVAWVEVARRLRRVLPGRRILAPDQRGFGQSDPAPTGSWYHFPEYVADLDALVHTLGDGPIDLVGHSMGGTVAGWYAGARPQRVRRLVLVEGLGPMATAESAALDQLRLFLDGLQRPPRPPIIRDAAHAEERLRRRHPLLSAEHAALLAAEGTRSTDDGGTRWSFDRMHLVRSPIPFREAWFAEALAAITAPTLVVWATEGWYPEDMRTRRAAMIGRAAGNPPRVAALAGGHMLPYDAPDALAEQITAHLRR